MVSNLGKSHFLWLGQKTVNETIVYGITKVKNSKGRENIRSDY